MAGPSVIFSVILIVGGNFPSKHVRHSWNGANRKTLWSRVSHTRKCQHASYTKIKFHFHVVHFFDIVQKSISPVPSRSFPFHFLFSPIFTPVASQSIKSWRMSWIKKLFGVKWLLGTLNVQVLLLDSISSPTFHRILSFQSRSRLQLHFVWAIPLTLAGKPPRSLRLLLEPYPPQEIMSVRTRRRLSSLILPGPQLFPRNVIHATRARHHFSWQESAITRHLEWSRLRHFVGH